MDISATSLDPGAVGKRKRDLLARRLLLRFFVDTRRYAYVDTRERRQRAQAADDVDRFACGQQAARCRRLDIGDGQAARVERDGERRGPAEGACDALLERSQRALDRLRSRECIPACRAKFAFHTEYR